MPAPGSMGEAYLYVNSPDFKGQWDLPPISNIEVSFYTNLSELPTVVMGFRNNFIMDLGNTQKISLTMKRTNPRSYNENSSSPDDWSNGKWYRELEKIMDYWQNFGKSSSNKSTGGFLFHYTPSDTSLYPVMDKNVFLNGSLSIQYATQYIVVQMNLTVARMEGGDAGTGNYVTVVMDSGISGHEESYTTAAGVQTQYPYPPNDWTTINPGYLCVGWASSPGQSIVEFEPGTPVVWEMQNEPYTLYAVWRGPRAIRVFDTPGTTTFNVSSLGLFNITDMEYYIVGGGGGAGGCGSRGTISSLVGIAGGGGGSGGYAHDVVECSETRSYSITVGAGGSMGANQTSSLNPGDGTAGGDGGYTRLTEVGGSLDVNARGGSGGAGGPSTSPSNAYARGGSQVYAGGDVRYGEWGEDGDAPTSNYDNRGRGWNQSRAFDASASGLYANGAGAGGGACDLNFQANINGQSYDYVSKGGDAGGYWYKSSDGSSGWTEASNPTYGGGGASVGRNTMGATAGANGIVILIFY